MARNSMYSILVDAEFDVKQIQQQLDKINVPVENFRDLSKQINNTSTSAESMGLNFQQANAVFSKSVDIISSLVDKVYTLNSSIIELQKVSNLSGDGLDKYVDKLSKLGKQVARTGKPNRSEPVCHDGKVA